MFARTDSRSVTKAVVQEFFAAAGLIDGIPSLWVKFIRFETGSFFAPVSFDAIRVPNIQ